ncbi:serine proteinase [Indibacter alkaliphilus LW1]|uniref:Serine proteinase n=1 Tax=Indibacter alkaliphilus (strain CCUG 57479 / KCTC 22604 / LW1) TaxID=1189612 RepID=S2D7H2_INDAL|nr:S8 family serine peptidase [Indibacter alkaliphilus]EOZ95157.1 serine proteinase [Indibacter alkaliphilus LW1]
MENLEFSTPKSASFILTAFLIFFTFSCQDLNLEDLPLAEEADLEGSLSYVPDRYIVTLNDQNPNLRRKGRYEDVQHEIRVLGQEILSKNGIQRERIKSVYGHALTGFAAKLSSDELRRLRADSRIKSIEQDVFVSSSFNERRIPPGQDKPKEEEPSSPEPDQPGGEDPIFGGNIQNNPPKYLDRIDQRALPLNDVFSYENTGEGVTVYIPVGSIWEQNDGMNDRVENIFLTGNEDESSGVTTNKALTTGGFHFGSAKGVNLVGVRTYDGCCNEELYLSAILEAHDWILANGKRPGIVLINLVGPIESPAFISSLESLYNAGFSLFSSAGAWLEDACTWASSKTPYVFTVGLANLQDESQSTSNYGDCIDLFTTTTDWSHLPDAYEETLEGRFSFNPNFVAVGVAAGVAATYLEKNPTSSPEEVYQFLRNTSTKNVVKFSNSKNNHLLYNGMSMTGAGDIDPARSNFQLDLAGSSVNYRGNNHRIELKWRPIKNASGITDIYENGKLLVSLSHGIDSGLFYHEVSGRNLAPRKYKICLSGTSLCSNEVTVTF